MRSNFRGRPVAITCLAVAAVLAAPTVQAQPVPQVLRAGGAVKVVHRYKAEEARQGVAVDRRYLYAVDNSVIAKYDKKTGAKLLEWRGDPAHFPHINSCAVIKQQLVCASSNYPAVPQASSVEFFDPKTLRHLRTVSLGQGTGSLTWVDRWRGGWWAGFANYDAKGGESPRDHRNTLLVRFDDNWRRTESWSFPETVLERFKPTSTSGGAWRADGRLYVTGHDRQELYVLALPSGGAVLDHLATLDIPIQGQAIDWDESRTDVLYGISRSGGEIVEMQAPSLKPAPN